MKFRAFLFKLYFFFCKLNWLFTSQCLYVNYTNNSTGKIREDQQKAIKYHNKNDGHIIVTKFAQSAPQFRTVHVKQLIRLIWGFCCIMVKTMKSNSWNEDDIDNKMKRLGEYCPLCTCSFFIGYYLFQWDNGMLIKSTVSCFLFLSLSWIWLEWKVGW